MPGIPLAAVRKLDYDWPLIPHCTMPQRKHVPMGKPVIIGKMLAAKNPEPNWRASPKPLTAPMIARNGSTGFMASVTKRVRRRGQGRLSPSSRMLIVG